MKAREFWGVLKAREFAFFSGVPDSTFTAAYNTMVEDPEIRYIPAVREDVALGIASAAYLSNRRGGVMMQNSGIGNIINPLTSFSLMYKIPVLLIIGWRGYGGPPNDAPEHWIMGAKTTDFLELLDIPFAVMGLGGFEAMLDQLLVSMDKRSVPGALLVRKGVIE